MYGLLFILVCKYQIPTPLLHDVSFLSLRPISRFDKCRLSLVYQLSLLFLYLAVAFGDICIPFTYVQVYLSSLRTVISLISLYCKISLKLLPLFFGGPCSSFPLLIFLLIIFTLLLLFLFSLSSYWQIPWSRFIFFRFLIHFLPTLRVQSNSPHAVYDTQIILPRECPIAVNPIFFHGVYPVQIPSFTWVLESNRQFLRWYVGKVNVNSRFIQVKFVDIWKYHLGSRLHNATVPDRKLLEWNIHLTN